MASYRLTVEAKDDLYRIWLYGLETFGPAQADKYLDGLIERFTQLTESPYSYPAIDHIQQGYRRSVCGIDCIYYQIVNDDVEIIRVLGRQNTELQL